MNKGFVAMVVCLMLCSCLPAVKKEQAQDEAIRHCSSVVASRVKAGMAPSAEATASVMRECMEEQKVRFEKQERDRQNATRTVAATVSASVIAIVVITILIILL